MNILLYQISAIALGSFASQWAAWKLHIPAIVFLLLIGVVLGPVTGIVQPDLLLGDFLRPAISVAVAIILFESSLNLRFREIRNVRKAVRHLVFIGAPLGWFLIALAARYFAGLSWPVAITFGGMLVVTGPTVIIPLLRHARLSPHVGSVLKWEGVINDPVGVIFAVLALEYFRVTASVPDVDIGFYMHFAYLLAGMVLVSYLLGLVTAFILERGFMPEYLKAPFLVTGVIAIFTMCNVLMHESGLIAVTVYGMTLANRHVSSIEEIRRFKETITLLLVSGVFILLTAGLDLSVLMRLDIRGILFIAAILFLIRPLTVAIASIGTNMTWKEVLLVGWIAPRGIVCAAIAGVMGPLLVQEGYADGEKLLPLAFAIVLVTVVAHGLTAKPFARRLGLASEDGSGLVVVGASDWTIQLAELLKQRGVPVLIADTNWHHLRPARLADIPVYYGEILSDEAEFDVEFSQFGTLLAATDNGAYNAFVCNAFAADFGRERVIQIAALDEEGKPERKKFATTRQGRNFVADDMDYYDWWHRFAEGWRFRATRVGPESEDAGEEELIQGDEIKIGIVTKADSLFLRTPDHDLTAKEGDVVLAFAKNGSEA